MIEYIIVLVVVGIAAVYAGRHLWRESQGKGCENCNCPEKRNVSGRLTQID